MEHSPVAQALDTDEDSKRERLGAIVEDSEKEIFEIQQQTGLDTYWRAYFWLLRR
jgi:hypothetical protein